MSVRIQHVSKVYGQQRAVDNISFEVKTGEILGFLGPNGAGKSTTMKMITGYIPPTEGQIFIDGIDIQSDPIGSRKKIGYLPESNPLYMDMYVQEYLTFISSVHGIRDSSKAISDVIEMTDLGVERHKKIHQLSKGYKQRVGLAQALIHHPKILILDEPTTGLDPNQLGEIRELIKELGKSKVIIFSTHIMQEVQAVCDRVIIIQKGQLVADDTVQGLSAQISGGSGISFVLERNMDMKLLSRLDFVKDIHQVGTARYRLYGSDLFRLKKALFDVAMQENNTILELKDMSSNLEDTFKQLTKKEPV